MKILIVTNPETCSDTIHVYSAKCSQKLRNDVVDALVELDLRVEPGTDVEAVIDEITNELLHGRNYWFNETYCFETIVID